MPSEPTPLTLPAMVNAHSHAFQRALRGRAERHHPGRDDFWGWRETMYELAGGLDPDTLHARYRDAYREMAAAGYGAVGEFHYVHHQPDGTPYEDPNAMAKAAAAAAQEAGIAIVLLPAAYHRAGWDGGDRPPEGAQRRFSDPDVETFLARIEALHAWAAGEEGVSVGVAAHSPRAVPASWLVEIAAFSERLGIVRHVHAAEQRRELREVAAEHGCSPIELLREAGFLGARANVVHAVHVSDEDVAALGGSATTVVSCPTTEGNLGDGHPPLLALADAGTPIAIGSDQNLVLDPVAELHVLESEARRERQTRHALMMRAEGDLWGAVAAAGRHSLGLGLAEAGTIALWDPVFDGLDPDDRPAALVTALGPGPRTVRRV